MRTTAWIFLWTGGMLIAQTAPPPGQGKTEQAVEVKRVPPATRQSTKRGVPTPEQYPFTKLIGVLEDQPSPKIVASAQGVLEPPPSEVPKDWSVLKDVPLPETAKEALNASQPWMTEKQAPAPGKDGRVLYTFGAGLPTVVCAPLRVCVLELEAGEKVNGEPHIGDSVRWTIAPATAGKPDQPTSMIVIKPKQAGLDTNLLVTTDRRAYYVRLISKPEEYLARVAFSYPEDQSAQWSVLLVRQDQRSKAAEDARRVEPVETMENLYFDYRVLGGDDYIRPTRVVDDGKKTFIQMPTGTAVREAPVLVVIGPEGKPEMVNYRVKGAMYIVDRLFERGALLLGVGKKQRRTEIVRGTYKGSIKGGKDLYRDIGSADQPAKN
jgi:type IV secretion system protein VirB9